LVFWARGESPRPFDRVRLHIYHPLGNCLLTPCGGSEQYAQLMACTADSFLVECFQHSPRLGHVRRQRSYALHFGTYLERICPGFKPTQFCVFRARILLLLTC
jgi:hypothetical protein